MCGIVGGVSDRNVLPILIEGLKRLEYRGYDSAGVAFRENSKISLIKAKGRVLDLENKLPEKKIKSNQGIAHTRWATHGVRQKKMRTHKFLKIRFLLFITALLKIT